MAKKKIKGTRILAAILTAAMVFTSTPYTALAAEGEAGYVTVQNETEQTGQEEDVSCNAGDVSGGSSDNGENGDVSGGTGDISDNNGGTGETGDVSDGNGGTGDVSGPDSEVSVSGNDIAVYGATATGTLTVEGNSGSYSYDAEKDVITVKNGAELTFHSADGYGAENPSQTRIYVEKDAKATLTLDGVYINVSDKAESPLEIAEDSTGAVSVVLKGSNALTAGEKAAGIQKNGTADGTLTISGSGALTAQGGKYGAGIGSGYEKAGSNISISGGEVTATGGYGGAGIGGGMYGTGISITISGGTVTTTGGNGGAGVGSGYHESASNITISGGNVIAKGGYYGAGIGGGKNGFGSNIGISGGEVTATGGESGAGVGSGYYESGSNITISGGTVIAQGGNQGAGIGGGKSGAGNNIDISGGTVIATATAGDHGATGAGIGGGYAGMGNNITISGGTVTATSTATGEYGCAGAGIGGGYACMGIGITISGGTVTALSTADEAYWEGYGIGSGCSTGISGPEIYGGNIKASRLSGVLGKDGDELHEAYLARADLLLLAGKNAALGNPVLQTYNKKTGETKTLSYNLKDVCTMEDGYLYMYLPADTEDTVTRLVFDNAVYEATVKKFDYELEPGRYSDFTLISSTDGKAEYGEVLREDVPEDGIIPDGIWMSDLQAGGYTYTGKAITPSFRVYDGKKMLAVKKDYTVSYKNNIKAATADDAKKAPTITVKSTGNYKGTETCTFTINPASLDATEQRINIDNLYLAAPAGKNPKGIKAVPVVTDNGKKLSENKDYTVNHVTLNEQNPENKNANSYVTPGKYTVEITGKGNYTGTRQITVTLADVAKEQILMSKVTVAKVPDVTYDADLCEGRSPAGMTPALTVTYGSGKNKVTLYKEGDVNAAGETVSAENADYTVTWINNRYVGTATAVLTGTGKILEDGTAIGTYFGEKRITFKIKGTALSASMVSWADGSKNVSVVYNGEEQEPEVRVSLQKKVKGKDGKMVTQTTYLWEYDDYYKEGDYKVSYLKNVDAGTATVVITGVGGYTGTVKKTFKITQADLAAEGTEAKIGVADSIPFVKNGAKPAIVVTAKMANGNTVTLKEGKDYTVTYANNKAVSEGKNLTEKKLPLITVKGKGNFKGSIKQTFTITNKSLADKVNPITVTVADVPANKNKGKFVSKPVVTDETGTKLKEKTDYTLSYSLLMANGEETKLDVKKDVVNEPGSTIRITITGAGNYRGEGSVLTADYRITESDFKKVTVKVVPKTLPYTTKPVTLTEEDLILTMKVGTGRQAVVEELKLITDGDDTKDGYKIIGYKNNVNKGTAQVTLQGCGKYGGTKTVKFYIGTRPFFWWLRNV